MRTVKYHTNGQHICIHVYVYVLGRGEENVGWPGDGKTKRWKILTFSIPRGGPTYENAHFNGHTFFSPKIHFKCRPPVVMNALLYSSTCKTSNFSRSLSLFNLDPPVPSVVRGEIWETDEEKARRESACDLSCQTWPRMRGGSIWFSFRRTPSEPRLIFFFTTPLEFPQSLDVSHDLVLLPWRTLLSKLVLLRL